MSMNGQNVRDAGWRRWGSAMDIDGEEEEVPTCELTAYLRDSVTLSNPHFASGIRHLDRSAASIAASKPVL